jgi:hypothetical protein
MTNKTKRIAIDITIEEGKKIAIEAIKKGLKTKHYVEEIIKEKIKTIK